MQIFSEFKYYGRYKFTSDNYGYHTIFVECPSHYTSISGLGENTYICGVKPFDLWLFDYPVISYADDDPADSAM